MRELVKGERGRVYALFAIVMLASAFGNLSQTAVNAMMPEIMGEFSLDVSLGQWLTTSYMLVLGIAVPAATFLGKRFTTRQHVFIALAFFLVGALADCLASNFAVLLAGRICQAVSTGLLLPLMQTIAMTRFPEGRRATAMGIAGIAMGFAPNIGPTVGGALSFSFGWRSFFVLLLVGVAVLGVATALLVRGGEGNRSERFDTLSFMLSALGFGGLLLGFSEASSFALTSPFVWGPLAAGAVFLVLFVRRQKRVDDPLINMGIFKSGQYTVGFAVLCLLHASFMGVTLVIPLYVEGLCGGTALDAGIVLLPGTLAALFLNPLAGVLTDRFGIRPVTVASGALLAVGSVLMVFLDEETPLAVTTFCQAVRASACRGSWARSSRGASPACRGASSPTAARSPSRGARRAPRSARRRWCCSLPWRAPRLQRSPTPRCPTSWRSPSRPCSPWPRSSASWRRCAKAASGTLWDGAAPLRPGTRARRALGCAGRRAKRAGSANSFACRTLARLKRRLFWQKSRLIRHGVRTLALFRGASIARDRRFPCSAAFAESCIDGCSYLDDE